MKIGTGDVDGSHLLVGDSDALGVGVGVEFAVHGKARISGGGADQINDDTLADQRLGPPVHADEREQAVLDLVPLARAGRQVVNHDVDAEFGREALQLALPQPHARAVAAAVITSRLASGYRT